MAAALESNGVKALLDSAGPNIANRLNSYDAEEERASACNEQSIIAPKRHPRRLSRPRPSKVWATIGPRRNEVLT